jgi:hypothetical protein
MSRLIVVVLFGLFLPQGLYAAPAKELYGKSVAITWTETREQRPVGEQAWRQVSGSQTLNVYVSEAGRVFNNLSYSTKGGSAERKGEIAGSGKRSINFSNRSLLVLMPWGNGGATRITADFDAAFGSCNAQVTRAKESATSVTRVYSGIIKRVNETRSAQVSGVACSVRSGNVFAN